MKKGIKITLKVVGIFLVLLVFLVGFGYWQLSSNILNFEDNYPEFKNFKMLTISGYQFLDRNRNGELDIYEDDRMPLSDRVNNALKLMTIEEKIHILKGSGMKSGVGLSKPGEGIAGAVGTIVPTPRLGLPTIYLSDGPAGLRIEPKRKGEDRTYYCTAFPIATLLASTWNEDLVKEVGTAIGNEALEYGIDVLLGPGVNIQRNPLCGRNFEYYSEDPFLTGKMGVAMVNGIESNGVGTSVKHFVANNQETQRNYNDAIISNRALHEIYLNGFERIVKEAKPWTIMSSYNKVNGTYVAESKYLLTDLLRNDWGFTGVVMSDWFGVYDAVTQIKAGDDLLEPGTNTVWKTLKKAFKENALSEQTIDTSTKRILRLVFMSQKMKGFANSNNPDLKAHAEITRLSASEGMILLKNNQALPLQKSKNVALIGVNSYDFIAGGTGSGDVNEAYTISLEQGLENTGFIINAMGKELYVKHKNAHKQEFKKPEGMMAMLKPYHPPQLKYTIEDLSQIAQISDVAIITIGRNAGEGADRVKEGDFLLTKQETDIIQNTCDAFHKKTKKVIVVLNIGGVIETASWKERPDAILLAWQGGQEGGNSVADILSGAVNPSGKLPMTFAHHLEDYLSTANFPLDGDPISIKDVLFKRSEKPKDKKVKNKDYTNYQEGIYVGYRGFDKEKKDVSYPFGYGLSYTHFEYSNMDATLQNDTITMSLVVKNNGELPGKEVVQIYFTKPNSSIDRPNQELKSFVKTKNLKPQEQQEIRLQIPVSELRYWNESISGWALENGKYIIKAGTSSRNIRIEKEINL